MAWVARRPHMPSNPCAFAIHASVHRPTPRSPPKAPRRVSYCHPTQYHHIPHPFLSAPERRVVSTDTKIVKIWDVRTGAPFTSIQPLGKVGDLNDACVHPHSGLIMVACDAPHIHSFFVPALGPAPKWCSFLESLTEELEENKEATIYDDYRRGVADWEGGLGVGGGGQAGWCVRVRVRCWCAVVIS